MSDVYIKSAPQVFDAIVVGSGITGGIAAKELCERGLKVLMLDRGRKVEHRKDYAGEGIPPWQWPNRGRVSREVQAEQDIQRRCYAYNDATNEFFINDKKNPYVQKKPFNWLRGDQLGGKSLLWHRASYRMSDLDFGANERDGVGVDWPIRYADVKPWYEHVEKFVGISGSVENLDVLPDSVFLPPFEMNNVEKEMQQRIAKRYNDRKMIIGRCAHLSKPAQHHIDLGRVQCQARNECQKGCSFGAYYSTQAGALPAAIATGNLSVATDAQVQEVIYDASNNRAKGVLVFDRDTKETREYFAKTVFMCGSTLGTTQVLMNSRSDAFPEGIGNTSGVLGHYLMDHIYNSRADGRVPGFEDEYYYGRRPVGIYVPRFQNLPKGGMKDDRYLRGFAFQGVGERFGWGQVAQRIDGIGANLKANLQDPGEWRFGLHGSGEMLPDYDNKVSLNFDELDETGMPKLVIDCEWKANDLAMMKAIPEISAEMLESIGVKDIEMKISDDPPGHAIHEVGTARMGRDPKTSYLNGYNQSHEVPNLFVTDGAAWPSCGWQNPSLTFMALTARAADFAATQLKNKSI